MKLDEINDMLVEIDVKSINNTEKGAKIKQKQDAEKEKAG